MRAVTTDVLVVGAGPSGLTATACLARLGVPTITLSRHAGTAPQPRATVTNQRTVEIFRDLGLDQAIDQVGVPLAAQRNCVYATSFTGEEIFRYHAYGVGARASDYLRASPCPPYNLGQHLAEPLLLQAVRDLDADVRFLHELLSIEQSAEGVVARVLDRESGEQYEIRAAYVIAADGGRSRVAEQLGIAFDGQPELIHMINAWLEVDLTEHAAHRPGHLYAIVQPGGDSWASSGTFICVTPWREWVLVRQYDASQGEPDRSDEAVAAAARSLIGDPEIAVTVKGTSTWQVNNQVARDYRCGRVFLAGDAAHRHPPAGGLGSNTSIQDAYNLAWKIAFVLQGRAGEGLLDSYHQERQPVGRHMVARTMENLRYMAAVGEVLGLRRNQSVEDGWAALRQLASDEAGAEQRRAQLSEVIALQHYRSNAHGTDIGQRYTSSCAVVDDGTPWPESARDPELYYQPTTHPGGYLPHAWVERDRRAVSTLDLAGHGRFCLIVGIGGEPWVQAAQRVAVEVGVELPVFSVGYRCEYDDVLGEWAALREVDDRGALLVRPDRHIAWRAMTRPDSPYHALSTAVQQILFRTKKSVTGARPDAAKSTSVGASA